MTTDPDQRPTADGHACGAGTPMPAAPEPRGVSSAVLWGLLWGLLFAVLGIIGVREALLHWGVFGGGPDLPGLIERLDGQRFHPWVGVLGVLLIVLGLLLLVAALRRRPRRSYRVDARTGVYLKFAEAARLAELTAVEVPGVLSARVRPGRRQLRVTIATTGAEGTGEDVHLALVERFAALVQPPTVRVRALATGRQAQTPPPAPASAPTSARLQEDEAR